MSVLRSSVPRHTGRKPARYRLWLMAGGLAFVVLLAAWIDGGERALRPISEAVELPATGGSNG
jgi:Tfp pilus assembly protein PilN